MSPSIENTPSVATSARRAPGRSPANRRSRSSTSLWAKVTILAPDSCAPAHRQAWARESMKMTSLVPTRVGITPVLARYPEPNTQAASVPFRRASRFSRSPSRGWSPVTSREAPAPAP